MILTSTPQNSFDSSAAHQHWHSGHSMMRLASYFIVAKPKSCFRPFQPQRMVGLGSNNRKPTLKCQIGNFHPWPKSVHCPSHLFLTTENLYIHGDLSTRPNWKDDIENTEWSDLSLPFTAVKNLYLSKQFSPRIAPALQELSGERTNKVLSYLKNILLDGL